MAHVNERVCQYYLQPRGCKKGEGCDFKHPTVSPAGQVTNKVCEYFLKPRGCSKGAECDFLHPDIAPEQKMLLQSHLPQKARPCTYFNSPRGCIKGGSCDFAHPASFGMNPSAFHNSNMNAGFNMMNQSSMNSMMNASSMMNQSMNHSLMNQMTGHGGHGGHGSSSMDSMKICEFFQTHRGCHKGLACDFAHVAPQQLLGMSGGSSGMTPIGPVSRAGKLMKPKLCEYFGTPRGCIKALTCEFIHQQQKPCEFALSGRGCKKGKFCDYLHVDSNGTPFPGIDENSLPGYGKTARPTNLAATRHNPY